MVLHRYRQALEIPKYGIQLTEKTFFTTPIQGYFE
jgi:hypothetical protein